MDKTKCCITCIYQHDIGCPLELYGIVCTWNFDENSCNKYTPKQGKPGRIEPIGGVDYLNACLVRNKINEIASRINEHTEIINALNRRMSVEV